MAEKEQEPTQAALESEQRPFRIVSLEIENFKRIQAAEVIFPTTGLYVVEGLNASGKSSFLDAIPAAMAGRSAEGPEPLRRGAMKGRICLVLSNASGAPKLIVDDNEEGGRSAEQKIAETPPENIINLYIEKKFTAKGGSSLVVTGSLGGKPLSSPQAVLESIYGTTVDPVEFARMSAKDQEAALRRITGLDFSDLEKQEAEIREQRTDLGRQVKQGEAVLASMPKFPDAPLAEVSLLDLSEELAAAGRHNAEVGSLASAVDRWNGLVAEGQERTKTCVSRVNELAAALQKAQAEQRLATDELARRQQNLEGARQAVAAAKPADTGAIQAKMVDSQEVNKQVRANAARRTAQENLDRISGQHAGLEAALEKIADARQERLAAVKFPIEGLGFGPLGVTFKGIPFEQAADSEKLAASTAIGVAANPKFGALCIHDGSLLDDKGMLFFAAFAEEHKVLIIIERVGKDAKEASIIIEDGRVAKPAKK
jgi:hypothetical protein